MFAGSSALAAVPEIEAPPVPTGSVELYVAVWPQFVARVRAEMLRVGALLSEGVPHALEGEALVVAVPSRFHLQTLEESRDALLKHLNEVAERPAARLQFIVLPGRAPEPDAGTAPAREQVTPTEYIHRRSQTDPVVRAIMEHFGGEIVW
jgi:hypothetical protein